MAYQKVKIKKKKVSFNKNKKKLSSGGYKKCSNCGGDGIVKIRKK